jgi:hypothetical protein
MANTDPISPAARKSIAEQLVQFLPRAKAAPKGRKAAPAPAPELGESLAVCTLTAEQVRHPPADLMELAKPSGTWYHQVHTAGGATHAARSQTGGLRGKVHHVMQMLQSPVAPKIDAALTWLDAKLGKTAATVRLLIAPAYYVHALLIVRDKDLAAVLVDQPPGLTPLREQTEYPLKDFLTAIAQARPSGTLT